MKRLFFSVFALALGSFVFISCNDDDKVGNENVDNEKYMTVAEQQKAIQNSFEGIADAIEFTELSQAAEIVANVVGKKWSLMSVAPIVEDTALMNDTEFYPKLMYALQLVSGNYESFEDMNIDLRPLYMAADVHVVDSVIYGDSVAALVLNNIRYDVDYLLLNVFVEDHTVIFKAKIEPGDSELDYTNVEKKISGSLALPKLVEITITLDGKVLADAKGEFNSDYTISVTNDTLSEEQSFVVEGSQMSAHANVKVVGYELDGKLDFDENTGATGSISAKYGNGELLSISGKLDAVLKDVDFTDSVAMLIWAQNPEMLKSISANASLGGGQIEIKGSLENPFKDEDLAKYMGNLIAGVVLTDEQFEDMVAKFNELFKVGVYFKGYEKAQAVMKVKYNKAQSADADKNNAQSNGIIDEIGGTINKVGGYLVMEAHGEDGKLCEIPVEEYFKGVDINQFKQVIMDKAIKAFGPIIAQFESEESEEGNED